MVVPSEMYMFVKCCVNGQKKFVSVKRSLHPKPIICAQKHTTGGNVSLIAAYQFSAHSVNECHRGCVIYGYEH